VAGCFALLFILLVAFVLLLPYLVNLESMREKIEALLFQQVGGKVVIEPLMPRKKEDSGEEG
jgi:hypothetical protein